MVVIGIPLKYYRLADGRNILYLTEQLRRTIQKAGGFILPIVQVQDVNYCDTRYNELDKLTKKEKEQVEEYLNKVDGVILPGGHKITHYDEYLLERCIEKNIPTLGICLGMQLMSCYKEDFKVYPNESNINHFQKSDEGTSHIVKIKKDSKLYEILKKEELEVNSFHNYHVLINNNYKITATASDNYVEAIELKKQKFHIGIQWYPEIDYDNNPDSKKLIDTFIKECKK
ncbi:MAG: gamma-glutamyl-gamma-aminobutyrate hydrolase family protein [Bacilli bacterium]|nr:gamma-glutamyl-gamma-aminobutyrate hydrolase family protein [Bacilli bacterium]